MEIQPCEVYSSQSNYAVIKPPGRHYPGAVIQGDSLGILCASVLRIADCIKRGDFASEDLRGELEDLGNSLLGRMLHYQSVLKAHGIESPYRHVFSDADLLQLD